MQFGWYVVVRMVAVSRALNGYELYITPIEKHSSPITEARGGDRTTVAVMCACVRD